MAAQSKRPDEYQFARADGFPPDDRDLQQHVFRPAAEAVGIYVAGSECKFHRLNISCRQEVGVTPFEAMRAAGHSKPTTIWNYTITDSERDREHVAPIPAPTQPRQSRRPDGWNRKYKDPFDDPIPNQNSRQQHGGFCRFFLSCWILWWACADSNCRPLPCQGSALTN